MKPWTPSKKQTSTWVISYQINTIFRNEGPLMGTFRYANRWPKSAAVTFFGKVVECIFEQLGIEALLGSASTYKTSTKFHSQNIKQLVCKCRNQTQISSKGWSISGNTAWILGHQQRVIYFNQPSNQELVLPRTGAGPEQRELI